MKTIKKLAILMTAVAASGCTGLEIGGKAWITRVDEKQESQRTHRGNAVPLKCYFVDCTQASEDFQNLK